MITLILFIVVALMVAKISSDEYGMFRFMYKENNYEYDGWGTTLLSGIPLLGISIYISAIFNGVGERFVDDMGLWTLFSFIFIAGITVLMISSIVYILLVLARKSGTITLIQDLMLIERNKNYFNEESGRFVTYFLIYIVSYLFMVSRLEINIFDFSGITNIIILGVKLGILIAILFVIYAIYNKIKRYILIKRLSAIYRSLRVQKIDNEKLATLKSYIVSDGISTSKLESAYREYSLYL